jgi:type II secretory pathway pseudopilin PulG
VELLVVLVIISLLVGLARPRLQRALIEARAAEVIATLDAVREAAYEYQSRTGEWPGDESRGVMPDGLRNMLGDDFSFSRDGYVLDYDRWDGPFQVGVSIIPDDPRLGEALLNRLGGSGWGDSDRFTWVIE